MLDHFLHPAIIANSICSRRGQDSVALHDHVDAVTTWMLYGVGVCLALKRDTWNQDETALGHQASASRVELALRGDLRPRPRGL